MFSYTHKHSPIAEVIPIESNQVPPSHLLNTINGDIAKLNLKIRNYNSEQDENIVVSKIQFRQTKISELKEIQAYYQEMDDRYTDTDINKIQDYQQKIYSDLFIALKQQRDYWRVDSNFKSLSHQEPLNVTFAELIDNMSPAKFSKMLSILATNSLTLNSLYLADDESLEHQHFQSFFANHKLELAYLGRSVIFYIRDNNDSMRLLVKLEDPIIPKCFENNLRRDLEKDPARNFLTLVFTRRRATYQDSMGNFITKTLSVSQYCSNNLADHATKSLDKEELIANALEVGIFLGGVIKHAQNLGYLNTDLKISNFLVAENSVNNKVVLKMADIKGFMPESRKGMISPFIPRYNHTMFSTPPEFKPFKPFKLNILEKQNPIPIDRLHAYSYGQIMYEYLANFNKKYAALTEFSPEEIALLQSQVDFDCQKIEFSLSEVRAIKRAIFRLPLNNAMIKQVINNFNNNTNIEKNPLELYFEEIDIFEHSTCKPLKEWIKNLVHPDPEQRLSIDEAINELNQIQASLFFSSKKRCWALLEKILTLGTDVQGKNADSYVYEWDKQIEQCESYSMLVKIESQIKAEVGPKLQIDESPGRLIEILNRMVHR